MKAYKLLSYLNIAKIVALFLFFSMFLFFDNIFNGIINTKFFLFYFSVGLLIVLVIIKIIIKGCPHHIKLDIIDILIVIFLLYGSIRYYNMGNIASFNTQPSLLFVLVVYFFIIKHIILPHREDTIKTGFVFVICLLLVSILQSIVGILQLYGVLNTFKSTSIMSGTMINTALFSMLLSVIYPIALYYYFFNKKIKSDKIIYYLSVFSLILTLSIIPFSENRISWISISFSTLLIFTYKYWLRIKSIYQFVFSKKVLFYSLISFVCIISIAIMLFLFHFKEDSSLGRLFVWKVSLLNIKEYIFNGVGFGGFEYQYNKWQAEYFMNHPDDIANAQLADYISFAYNEFLHVFIETGIIGLFIFIAVIYFVIRNTLIRIKKGNKITLLFIIPFSISFFSFVTISLISYPLQNIHLLIFFFTLIAILSYDMPSLIEINRFRMPITIAILFMTAAFSFSRFVYIKPYMKWKEADISYHNEDYSLSVQIYSNTIDYLGKDALFLQYYGKSLQMAGEHSKSVEILTESIKKRTDQQAYICLAIDNIGMQMYDSAETNLLYASSLIPNRLYPVYLLAKVFYSIDDLEKAKMYVNKGLNIPVKIPSSAISEMRTELNYLLQQCKEQSNQ